MNFPPRKSSVIFSLNTNTRHHLSISSSLLKNRRSVKNSIDIGSVATQDQIVLFTITKENIRDMSFKNYYIPMQSRPFQALSRPPQANAFSEIVHLSMGDMLQ